MGGVKGAHVPVSGTLLPSLIKRAACSMLFLAAHQLHLSAATARVYFPQARGVKWRRPASVDREAS